MAGSKFADPDMSIIPADPFECRLDFAGRPFKKLQINIMSAHKSTGDVVPDIVGSSIKQNTAQRGCIEPKRFRNVDNAEEVRDDIGSF
jgi:hypothetical protein